MSDKKPDGFLDLLKGMTAEEICAVNSNVRPVSGSPIDEVVEAIDKATRETAVPSAVREKFVAVAKDGGDQVAGLLSLMRATIPSLEGAEESHQQTLAAAVQAVAEKYGVTLPVIQAKEGDDEDEAEAEAAAADDAEKKDDGEKDDDGEAEESAAEKKADAAVARIDAHEARRNLDEAVRKIAVPSVAKLVQEEVDKQIEAGTLKPDGVQEAVDAEVARMKRAAEAVNGGASSFEDLEPSDLDIDLSRTTEGEDGEPTAGEAAFYGW